MSIGVTEAAKLLGISDRQGRNLARQESFPSFRIGKRIMISYDGLRQWSAARAEA